jgi:hypothetical protein
VADHVVGQEADRAALESRKAGHGDRREVTEERAQRLERIAVRQPLRVAVAVAERETTVLGDQDQPGLGPEERIARPRLAALDRLQEERVGAGSQAQIRRQRRVEIGGQLGEDGDDVAPSRELAELVTRRRE